MIQRVIRGIEWVNARGRAAVAIAILLGIVATPCAVMLFRNLRAQIEELLPRDAPSIQALDNLHERLGSSMQLMVYVSGEPLEKVHPFFDRYAAEAAKLPLPARFVDYKPEEIQRFFQDRKSLFIETADLMEVEKRIDARVAYEKKKNNPFNLGFDDDEKPPEVDSVFDKYKGKATDLHDYASGYYDSEDGKSAAIIFFPEGGATDYEKSIKFKAGIDQLGKKLAAEMGMPNLKIQYSGDVEQVIMEQLSLQEDLVTSSLIVLLFEALLIFGFYRWWPSIFILGFPLGLGTVVAFALGWIFIGSLNASSAFLGAIIVGNGINSGVMLLSRFVEERRRGLAAQLAMTTAVRGTFVATVIAALASAIAYGALMVTGFRGYSHFGFMGGAGMVLCWVFNFLLIPPIALWFEQHFPLKHFTSPPVVDRFFGWLGRFNVTRSRAIAVVSVLVTAASLVAIAQIAPDPIENDTSKLRSKWANEPGGYNDIAVRVDKILQKVQTPAVLLVKSEADVKRLEKEYRTQMKNGPEDQLMGRVFTIFTLVPDEQEKKLEVFGRIRKQLSPNRLNKLDEHTREMAKKWLPSEELKPYGVLDLPEDIRRQVREKDGTEGKLVLLYPKHGVDTSDGRIVRKFAKEVRSIPLPKGAWAAGSYLVFADMIESINHDGPMATLLAFLSVIVLSLVLARGARGSFIVTASLVLGVIWTCGSGAATGMRINFLNFIALPITFGIGVDYATNVYGRYMQSAPSRRNLVETIEFSGAAVAVASLTTVIGYASLLFSRNGALYSFGMLACLGEVACLAAAEILLPAILCWKLPPLSADPVAVAPKANGATAPELVSSLPPTQAPPNAPPPGGAS